MVHVPVTKGGMVSTAPYQIHALKTAADMEHAYLEIARVIQIGQEMIAVEHHSVRDSCLKSV